MRTAFEIARTGRPGPVVVDMPKDVQNWEGIFHGGGMLPIPGYRRRMRELDRVGDRARGRRRASSRCSGSRERPLIYAGGGVINGNAAGALAEFASAFGMPVVTTLMGIGAFDTTGALALRMLGMHGAAFANYAVDDCDFLIAVGARFDDRVAGVPAKFARNARAHRAPRRRSRRGQQGQARALEPRRPDPEALQALTAHGRGAGFARDYSPWHAEVAELKRVYAMNYDRASDAHPAVLRDRGDQPPHARARRSSPPASANIRCGPRSTATSAARACG